MSNIIKVVGISNEISNHVVTLVTRSILQFAAAPIVGVVVEYEALSNSLRVTIDSIVNEVNTRYQTTASISTAQSYNDAIKIIQNSNFHDYIKAKTIERLLNSFEDTLNKIGNDLRKQGF